MLRTAVGVWVLILVVVGLVAGSSLLGPGEPGSAVRQSPPAPPAVGSCLRSIDDPAVVPCTTPHVGEVVEAWGGAETGSAPDSSGQAEQCWPAVLDFVGDPRVEPLSPGITWVWPLPDFSTAVVGGPGHEQVPEWSWSACVLVQDGSQKIPSMREVADSRTPRPAGWRFCSTGPDIGTSAVPCTVAHRFETIATGTIDVISPELVTELVAEAVALGRTDGPQLDLAGLVVDHPAAADECRSLVEIHLGGSRPAGEEALRSSVVALGFLTVTASDDVITSREGLVLSCVVEVVGESDLVDSVAGIGSGPLPYE